MWGNNSHFLWVLWWLLLTYYVSHLFNLFVYFPHSHWNVSSLGQGIVPLWFTVVSLAPKMDLAHKRYLKFVEWVNEKYLIYSSHSVNFSIVNLREFYSVVNYYNLDKEAYLSPCDSLICLKFYAFTVFAFYCFLFHTCTCPFRLALW